MMEEFNRQLQQSDDELSLVRVFGAEVDRLRAENDRLRGALQFYANIGGYEVGIEIGDSVPDFAYEQVWLKTGRIIDDAGDIARAALEGEE
jgi:hypothetical protein